MALLAAMALPGRAYAEGGDGFRLDSSGQVTLDSGHAAREGVSSLRFTLTVDAGPGDAVAFEFAGSNACILEYQYNENDNTMDIYLAGTKALFAEGTESLDIGRVVVQGGDGGQGSAMVGVEGDSLQYVYGSKVRTMENVSTPEAVRVSAGTPPPARPEPGGTEENNGDNSWQAPTQSTQAPAQSTPVPDTQNTGNKKPSGMAKPSGNPKPESTPTPSPRPSPPVIPGIEPVEVDPPGGGGTEGEDMVAVAPVIGPPDEGEAGEAGDGFWEAVKPVLTGFAIAAAAAGIGAAAVLYLVRDPRRRR